MARKSVLMQHCDGPAVLPLGNFLFMRQHDVILWGYMVFSVVAGSLESKLSQDTRLERIRLPSWQ